MLRYSLGSLFLVLLYLSIGCAALVNATGIWPQVAITLAVAILVLFSLAAIFWTGRRRVFAIGFTATGWLYFLLVFSEVTYVRPFLLTETVLNRLFITMHSDQTNALGLAATPANVQPVIYSNPLPPPLPVSVTPANSPRPVYNTPVLQPITATAYWAPAGPPRVDSRSFNGIGHSLWAVIIAFAGGITAQLLTGARKPAATSRE